MSCASEAKLKTLGALEDSGKNQSNTTTGIIGNRIVSMVLMSALIAQMACPKCLKPGCTLEETKRLGLISHLKVCCGKCGNIISAKTSPTVGGRLKTSETNLRAVISGRDCGMGFQKIVRFFAGLDIPKPFHFTSYQALAKTVGSVALQAAQKCMDAAAAKIRQLYRELDPSLPADGPIPIIVTYDGTWHRRGHSSHYGVGVVVELYTGFVLDTFSLSNFCLGCKLAPSKNSPLYSAWLDKHRPVCQCNHQGSANSMEVAAAKVLFGRSVKRHGLKYLTVVCDGDAKTVASINEAGIYTEEVVKEDCVNHVAKRMWTAMDNLKKKLKGTSERISGKGKLTQAIQDKLSAYYASQLKENAPDVEKMRKGVYASLFHSVSTDDDPHHAYCPEGPTSWCFFQRAAALKEKPRAHRPTFTRDVAEKLLPIYERLTNPDLLKRCTRMKTQNANECFNAKCGGVAQRLSPLH